MKIVEAEFSGFKGVYAGMGRDSIKLDFSKSTNNIVMLLGGNGSGKTTLMSLLHPFRDTYDSRKDIIMDDTEGYKSLKLVHNNIQYHVEHLYGKKNKSFFKKDGIELNENGGIRTFNSIVEEELGLNPDYFKIARLGSNVTTFINLKTAERKKYINNFIPNIDDYLESFDIVDKKFKVLKSSINVIKDQLSGMSDAVVLEEQLSDSKELIIIKEESIKELEKIINEYEFTIEANEKKLVFDSDDFNGSYMGYMQHLKDNAESKGKELAKVKSDLTNLSNKDIIKETNKEDLSTKSMELVELRATYKSNINMYTAKIDSLKSDNILINNKISSYSSELNLVEDVQSIKDQYNNFNNQIVDYMDIFNNIDFPSELKSSIDVNIMNDSIMLYNHLDSSISNIKTLFTQDLIDNINLSEFHSITMELEEIKSKSDVTSDKINYLFNTIKNIEGNKNLLTVLGNRPTDCIDDSCSFIKHAIDYKNNDYSRLEDLNNELDELNEELSVLTSKQKELTVKLELLNNVKFLYNNTINSSYFNKVSMFLFKEEFTTDLFIEMVKLQPNVFVKMFRLDKINELKRINDNINSLTDTRNTIKNRLDLAIEKAKVTENYSKLIEELEKEKESNNSKIASTKKLLDDNLKLLEIVTNSITIINKYISFIEEETNLTKDIKNSIESYNINFEAYKTINQCKNKIIEKQSELKEMINSLSSLNETKSNIERSLYIIDDCKRRLKENEDNFTDLSLIQKALDPKKGIPLFFINNYLKDIAIKSNDLLSVAYGDSFKINFDVTASDFYINVFKDDGTNLDDIEQASQGEVSLTSVSLSLGMIERMMDGSPYNILYLDEIDGTLSTRNRRLFITMLENQLEKLGIEQVFIISHNNEFDAYPVDLVLLNDNNIETDDKAYMLNKNVVFNIAD